MVPWRQCKYPTSTCLLISYVAILPLKGIMIPVFFFFAPAPISIAGVQALRQNNCRGVGILSSTVVLRQIHVLWVP